MQEKSLYWDFTLVANPRVYIYICIVKLSEIAGGQQNVAQKIFVTGRCVDHRRSH